ncbi:MAG: flavodoxin-dependent (E)-4-hydroxy-3-methylbut-2-enyl-diphosphate synthase, partial [Clostridia bacterium]|nr:flavodoxin-dependent (E)-4-hydroxy-3-methylbut-2-enyl-diphosphate synthase [Clostridia bacterium]
GLSDLPLRVALMGCVVNGPGEAREADIGICGGEGEALLIAKGKVLRKIPEDDVINVLIDELKKIKAGI